MDMCSWDSATSTVRGFEKERTRSAFASFVVPPIVKIATG